MLIRELEKLREVVKSYRKEASASKAQKERDVFDKICTPKPVKSASKSKAVVENKKSNKNRKKEKAKIGTQQQARGGVKGSIGSLSDEDDSEDDSEDISVLADAEIKDFVWSSNLFDKGMFLVKYSDYNKEEYSDPAPFLYDYPDIGLAFMYHRYLHDEKSITYIEGICGQMYEADKVEPRRVVVNFTNIVDYAKQRGWKEQVQNSNCRIKQVAGFIKRGGKKNNDSKKKANLKCPPNDPNEEISIQELNIAKEKEIENNEDAVIINVQKKLILEKEFECELEMPDTLVVDSTCCASTPTNTKKDLFRIPAGACKPPMNHMWDCCDSGRWVDCGRLSGGITCIGKRDGKRCNRLFVNKTLQDGTHQSESEFHPTSKKPGYGCTRCDQAMCKDCHDYYERVDRTKSPARSKKIVK